LRGLHGGSEPESEEAKTGGLRIVTKKKPKLGGKPSYFRGKSASPQSGNAGSVPRPRTFNFTWKGNKILDSNRERLGLSVNEFLEALTRLHGPTLTLEDVKRVADPNLTAAQASAKVRSDG
jgi:hypothetical protein